MALLADHPIKVKAMDGKGGGLAGDAIYRFAATEVKATSHRLDGVLWPRHHESGTASSPVVLLEVQMHSDPGFHHRLAAETFRFLQQHPHVVHCRVVVITPHSRLRLEPGTAPRLLAGFIAQVQWFSLEELSRRQNPDPLVDLLTLPVRQEQELPERCQAILRTRPELLELIVPILVERFEGRSLEEIMVIIGTPIDELRHTRAAQQLISEGRAEGRSEGRAEGRSEGRVEGEVALTLRLLARRCGPLSADTTATIQALSLPRLEELADALLDFQGAEDLRQWLARQGE